MHCLKVPDLVSILRLDADNRLGEEIVSLPRAAEPIVARRAYGEIDQTAPIVDTERRPDVRMADGLPRFVVPCFRAFVAFVLRRGTETPGTLAGFDVERLH